MYNTGHQARITKGVGGWGMMPREDKRGIGVIVNKTASGE